VTARLVLDCRNIVGESLIWVDAEQSLYWVDIVGSRIHRWAPDSGAQDVWATPELPTSIGLRKDGGFIVGLRQRVCLWRPGGSFETFAVPEPDLPGNRLNEGVVAPDGSFWVGTMAENIGPDGGPQPMSGNSGALYRIAPDAIVTQLTDRDFGITNTMIWTDDGRFITADTLANELYAYDLVASDTGLANRRTLPLRLDRGLPDGSTRDSTGTIYNARVAGGGAAAIIAGDGASAEYVDLPCASPTSCAFGGPDLATLYITSARFGMTTDQLVQTPTEGGLFAINVPAVGRPTHRFG
jgi:sugar lactone lactonase YvrE